MAEESKLSKASQIAQIVGLVPSVVCMWAVLFPNKQPSSVGAATPMSEGMPRILLISLVAAIVCFLIGGILQLVAAFQRRSKLRGATHQESPPARLKIIEARYGVEGGPDVDVYEKYLKPRIHGDALVGWVGVDLFGGYQPVINVYKRLRVRYSFEGRERTIMRGENQMIVIPEDDVLREEIEDCETKHKSAMAYVNKLRERINSLADRSVSESDPLVYPEFVDARWSSGSDKKELQAYFSMENRGAGEAINIVLEPIEMGGKIVQFTRHRIAAALLPKKGTFFYPDVVTKENQSVPESSRDLFHLFCLDYISLGDATIIEATTSLVATYQDKARNLFEVTCELVFDPAAHADVRMGNRGMRPVICTRNHNFRKVAMVPLSQDEGKK
ncbi:MAG TPA: hypothetical protein VGF88_02725 [Acidobacteriaceae bacterium]|jgi:hypothetical protein